MEFRHSIQTIAFALVLPFALCGQPNLESDGMPSAQADGLIQRLPLTALATYSVGISPDVPTTILLPDVPTAFDGVGFTKSSGVAAPVYLQHTPGSKWFTVRALFPKAQANLNLILKGEVYSFYFHLSNTPHRTLVLFRPPLASAKPKKPRAAITVDRLIALLDDVKSYHLVKEQYPNLYRPIEHRAALSDEISPYADFQIITDQVYRFPSDDTMVFRIIFNNPNPEPIRYDPAHIGLRVTGSPIVYWQSIADVSGVIPAARIVKNPDGTERTEPGQSWGYVAITGNPDGSRANLSLSNRFDVLVQRRMSPSAP